MKVEEATPDLLRRGLRANCVVNMLALSLLFLLLRFVLVRARLSLSLSPSHTYIPAKSKPTRAVSQFSKQLITSLEPTETCYCTRARGRMHNLAHAGILHVGVRHEHRSIHDGVGADHDAAHAAAGSHRGADLQKFRRQPADDA